MPPPGQTSNPPTLKNIVGFELVDAKASVRPLQRRFPLGGPGYTLSVFYEARRMEDESLRRVSGGSPMLSWVGEEAEDGLIWCVDHDGELF